MEKIYLDAAAVRQLYDTLKIYDSSFWKARKEPTHKRAKIVLKKCEDADKLEEELEKESRDTEILAKALMCHKACDYEKFQPIKYIGHESYDL